MSGQTGRNVIFTITKQMAQGTSSLLLPCTGPVNMQLELSAIYDIFAKTRQFHDCVRNSVKISTCTLTGAGIGYLCNAPQGVALGAVAGFSLGYVFSPDCPSIYQTVKDMPLDDKKKLYFHGSRFLQGLAEGFLPTLNN